MEFSSKNTYHDDLTKKMDVYASLEIQDYFLYDAEGLYLPSQLIGFELVDGNYVPIPPDENGGIRSSSLGLDFRIRDEEIAVFDPVTNDWVRARAEAEAIRADTAEARAEQEANARQKETTRADTAEARAEQEATRADTAEAEAAQLREQLARLQASS